MNSKVCENAMSVIFQFSIGSYDEWSQMKLICKLWNHFIDKRNQKLTQHLTLEINTFNIQKLIQYLNNNNVVKIISKFHMNNADPNSICKFHALNIFQYTKIVHYSNIYFWSDSYHLLELPSCVEEISFVDCFLGAPVWKRLNNLQYLKALRLIDCRNSVIADFKTWASLTYIECIDHQEIIEDLFYIAQKAPNLTFKISVISWYVLYYLNENSKYENITKIILVPACFDKYDSIEPIIRKLLLKLPKLTSIEIEKIPENRKQEFLELGFAVDSTLCAKKNIC